jgi:hypothetical protein
MLNALNCAPTTCTCGRRMGKPQYGYPWVTHSKVLGEVQSHESRRITRDKVWFVPCKCGLRHLWSYPSQYVARSLDPLFDSKTVTTRSKGVKGHANKV